MFTFRFEYSVDTPTFEEAVKEMNKVLLTNLDYFPNAVADVFHDGERYMRTVDFSKVKDAE